MEQWLPLFDIFLNSPTPESEASTWLKQSFSASSSTAAPITTGSFLSLLMKPLETIDASSGGPSPNRVMFIQTLPNVVQARVLSFLALDRERFSGRELGKLARNVLSCDQGVDFWVQKSARHLLDVMSESNYEWISCLGLDSREEEDEFEFESLPDWLKLSAAESDSVMPWLPISAEELSSRTVSGDDGGSLSQVGGDEDEDLDMDDVVEEMNIDSPKSVDIEPGVREKAISLKERVVSFESTSKTVGLANEIREFCLDKGGECFAVLGLIEPWLADDETASVLLSHLTSGGEEELTWPSQVLCSIVLPKLLVLEEPASRVLVTSIVEYCRLHQRAAEYALLFPLILQQEGINNPIYDVITRVIKESLHPAHVSSFCQKLLCGEKDERRVICLPCHKYLITDKMVWTESLFSLLQSILNHNIHFTQSSVDHIVYQVQQLAETFSNSLKFGNFLLCLVTKCSPLLKPHKLMLTKVVEQNKTFLAKSILCKIAGL
ncbi:putative fanconi Anaemia group E protein [Rosa chinensis]|uniref:Putative fanconi Anaemia group E protein n=1 Tax=Rosa chinensis TaxID=74649 RepID=A0A2P6RK75_ROSCH|nr:uncharacterized protein LOC112184268 [Rosa chinensis]PRQ46817.1 putative fanconi Anaemia group E protein [Rosa chinensis]